MSSRQESHAAYPPEPDEAVRVCNDVLWLANNMHNYGTDQWRDFFMACVRDARRVVGIEADRG